MKEDIKYIRYGLKNIAFGLLFNLAAGLFFLAFGITALNGNASETFFPQTAEEFKGSPELMIGGSVALIISPRESLQSLLDHVANKH